MGSMEDPHRRLPGQLAAGVPNEGRIDHLPNRQPGFDEHLPGHSDGLSPVQGRAFPRKLPHGRQILQVSHRRVIDPQPGQAWGQGIGESDPGRPSTLVVQSKGIGDRLAGPCHPGHDCQR